jgi:hypothetical protein
MPCPTCDHTMHLVIDGIFWCPRCGTLNTRYDEASVPKLVGRCRKMETTYFLTPFGRRVLNGEATRREGFRR